jgi:hypothetical protein
MTGRWNHFAVGAAGAGGVSEAVFTEHLQQRRRGAGDSFVVHRLDGSLQWCYSPATVVDDYLVAGQDHVPTEFVTRAVEAFVIARERVRELAAGLTGDDVRVLVEGLER